MNSKHINLVVDISKMALVIATSCLLVSAIVILVSDIPGEAINSFFLGPFSTIRRIGNIIEAATPLMFTGLAVIIIFRSGQFSMISEGSFFIGACGAMIAGISWKLPFFVHPLFAIFFGAILGSLAACIPAILKLFWRTSELVTSIMLNYVCLYIALYIMNYHYRDTATTAFQSHLVRNTARLVGIIPGTRIHFGVLIALVLCGAVWVFLFHFRLGFKIRITGSNALFAKYAGIGAAGVMFTAQAIAGMIAGAGGAVELLGMYSRFRWMEMPGYGWTGIVVALLARLNPLLVPLSACFIAYLNVGADIMSRSSDVSSEVVLVIQGVMMLLIAADALLSGWRQRLIVKAAELESREVSRG
jgi:simple sugar transport system permease protein